MVARGISPTLVQLVILFKSHSCVNAHFSTFDFVKSIEKETSAHHLVSILGLLALPDWVSRHLGDISLLFVTVVEACPLVASHGQFVLILNITLHSLVLEAVLTHLLSTCVLSALGGALIHLCSNPGQGGFELFQGHAAILVQIELFHESSDLILEWWKPIRLCQQHFDLVGGNRARVVLVDAPESGLEFLVGENVDAEGVNQIGTECVRWSQCSDSKEAHL